MGNVAQTRILFAAMVGLCEVVALHSALAGQPLEKVAAALSRGSKDSRSSAAVPALKGRLDLRPPAEPPAETMAGNEAAAGSFSASGNHRLFAGPLASGFEVRASAPAASQGAHIMSPMQTLAHNFRQEGLPLAKLFQNNESLVHLGLNPKGKPGLWIVHKLH